MIGKDLPITFLDHKIVTYIRSQSHSEKSDLNRSNHIRCDHDHQLDPKICNLKAPVQVHFWLPMAVLAVTKLSRSIEKFHIQKFYHVSENREKIFRANGMVILAEFLHISLKFAIQ